MATQDPERGSTTSSNRGNSAALRSYNGHGDWKAAAAAEDDERKWSSWLIPVLVVTNVAVFVVVMYINDCPKHNQNVNGYGRCVARSLRRFSFQPTRENPLFGPSSATLKKLGALEWLSVAHRHQGWRLISCIWLHAGVIHLLVNMLSLVFIGVRIEQQFGFVNIGIIYVVSGFGGSVFSSLFVQKSITVGASGALLGLLGAMLGELITNWTIYTNKVAALVTIVLMTAINLAVGIAPHVNNFAHIGGFLTGFLLGLILLPRPCTEWLTSTNQSPQTGNMESKYKVYQLVLALIALLLLVAGFAVALVMVFDRKINASKHCSWCHYLSCVPTSKWKCDVE